MKYITTFCLLIATLSVAALSQSGGNFTMNKSVIAGGGGHASGGSFVVDRTIGQSVAGTTSTGGSFSLGSGFWGGGSAMLPTH